VRPALLLLAVAATLAHGWFALAAPVAAHTLPVGGDPPDLCTGRFPASDPHCTAGAILATPPATVRLTFTEPVEPVGDGITVVAPSGARVDRGPARVVGADLLVDVAANERGTYRVTWRVTSADTHAEAGSYTFSIGEPSVAAPLLTTTVGAWPGLALQTVARWVHFGGLALAFGPLALSFCLPAPLGPASARRLGRLVGAGIGALLLAEPLALLAQTVTLSAGGPLGIAAAADALASSFGRVAGQRAGLALLLWVLGGVPGGAFGRVRPFALAVGVVLALVDGQASHAIDSDPAPLGVALNALHLGAMAVWLGGLVALVTLWPLPEIAPLRRPLLRRFGRVAGGALALLVVSGTALAAQHLPALRDLVASNYGRVLLLKIIAVADVALVAFSAARLARRDPAAATRLPRWWRGELLLLAGVLALAGLLVSLAPPG
jgi:copper transport protein